MNLNLHHIHHHHHHYHGETGHKTVHEHHQLLWRPYELFIAMLSILVVGALTWTGIARATPNLSSPAAVGTSATQLEQSGR